jgi:hypothetical protein
VADTRSHRGPHPEDDRLFGPAARPRLAEAVADLCWLLTRGYATPSALKLVGDRHTLDARQRVAVARCACSDAQRQRRSAHRVDGRQVRGRRIWLDGYNVLTTIEAALGGGVILDACDGAYRDMASMHGSYRKVAETRPALELLGRMLGELGAGPCRWCLDRPVSNSGRLKQIIEETAELNRWPWEVELLPNPDPVLAHSEEVVATADSVILDQCQSWLNLARETIAAYLPEVDVVRLGMTTHGANPAG